MQTLDPLLPDSLDLREGGSLFWGGQIVLVGVRSGTKPVAKVFPFVSREKSLKSLSSSVTGMPIPVSSTSTLSLSPLNANQYI